MNKHEAIKFVDYCFNIADYLDENFNPNPDKTEELSEMISNEIRDYFARNIAFEIAAELIAQKIKSSRINKIH